MLACSFKLPHLNRRAPFILPFLNSMVLERERDTIGKEYMMYVCVCIFEVHWVEFYIPSWPRCSFITDPNVLLHIQVYYCKGIQTAGQILYYSLILNTHHMEERFK